MSVTQGHTAGLSTKERIPLVALELFAGRGYEATSMREIAEQLNITKAALYYHFSSKEDIVRAVVESTMDQITALAQWAADQEVTPALRRDILERWGVILQAHGVAMFRFMMANKALIHGIRPDKAGMSGQVDILTGLITPPNASVEDRLRVKMALMSVTMVGMVSEGVEATDVEILDAARRIALSMLPAGILEN
ncbi:TetR/AcrR family transcriptional regulator [Pseudarthrobacter sp. P1]|uniref:TetR/AcrR family transcriptional regulator n=1 Tax=Pseudarthrobacter sp. P1 TaxID=3418418 RepID=UPI003CF12EBE